MAPTTLTVSDLSVDQRAAFDGIMSWLKDETSKPTLTLGGYAGTGKSTVVSVVAHELLKLGPIAFCAFTGKASSVLGRKLAQSGISTVNRIVMRSVGGVRPFEPRPYCGTIHGLIYRPCDVCMVEEKHEHTYGLECHERNAVDTFEPSGDFKSPSDPFVGTPVGGKCLACNPPPPVKKDGFCNRCRNERYLRRESLDRNYRLIVVDEASMVDDQMLSALLGYGIPILAVGDHGQLPPVKGQGSLMRTPDLRLERIHRQAEGSPIIRLSQRIRETGDIDDALEDGGAFQIFARRHLERLIAERWTAARLATDPMIAGKVNPEGALGTVLVSWTNRLRCDLNYKVREAIGLTDTPPRRGEVAICLKNAAPVYNGMRGVLVENAERAGDAGGKAPKWKMSVDFVEDGQKADRFLASEHQFFAEKTIDYEKAQELGVSMSALGQLYDFGYGLTCHKMQGSQAPEILVVVEPGLVRMGREDRTRWLYTACTRAADRLVVIR